MPDVSRRTFLTGAAAVAGMAALPPLAASPAIAAVPAVRPYSAGSFYKSSAIGAPISGSATSGSTKAFRDYMAARVAAGSPQYPLLKGLNGNPWGTPWFEGDVNSPVWKLRLLNSSGVEITAPWSSMPDPLFARLVTDGFRCPDTIAATLSFIANGGNSDKPFVVMDLHNGLTVWAASATADLATHVITIQSSSAQSAPAGGFYHASNGVNGWLSGKSPGGVPNTNANAGAVNNFRSRGAIPDAMAIRADLMAEAVANNGDLGHVLHFFIEESDEAAGFCHPMTGFETRVPPLAGWGAEGRRLVLNPSITLNDINTKSPWVDMGPRGRVIVRTLRKYGMYVGDNAGGPSTLKCQQDDANNTVWGAGFTELELAGLKWGNLSVVQAGWQ